jgi:type III secretion protein C
VKPALGVGSPAGTAAGFRPIARALLLGALAWFLSPAHSADAQAEARQLLSQPFVYKASEKKLSEVLQDFASGQGVPIVLAEGIEGSVSGSFTLTGRSFLKLMTDMYGLTWYYDGTALFVYPVKALQSKLFQLPSADVKSVKSTLEALGLSDPRFPLRQGEGVGVLLAFGPPRYIELISAIADSVEAHARDPARQVIRVFPLRHAHAGDRKVGGDWRPGVAQLLGYIYGSEGASTGAVAAGSSVRSRMWPSLVSPLSDGRTEEADRRKLQEAQGAVMSNAQRTLVAGAALPPVTSTGKSAAEAPAIGRKLPPLFEADEARNSVIVRAQPEQFAEIEELIRQFDVQRDMVELEAVIIDVNHNDVRDLGLRWEAGSNGATIKFGEPATSVANGGNFSIMRLAAGSSLQFMVSINALQAKGRARIVARPRVLGVTNQPAVMKDSRVASVRVSGNLSSSLYQVEAGTSIEMLARRVEPAHEKRLLLSISIEDGKFDEKTVDTVPIVQRTEIRTEAYVDEGEALLIGGISTERSTRTDSGVPGLADLPVIGGLFSSKQRLDGQSERLFLIVPRAISGSQPGANELVRRSQQFEEPAR